MAWRRDHCTGAVSRVKAMLRRGMGPAGFAGFVLAVVDMHFCLLAALCRRKATCTTEISTSRARAWSVLRRHAMLSWHGVLVCDHTPCLSGVCWGFWHCAVSCHTGFRGDVLARECCHRALHAQHPLGVPNKSVLLLEGVRVAGKGRMVRTCVVGGEFCHEQRDNRGRCMRVQRVVQGQRQGGNWAVSGSV